MSKILTFSCVHCGRNLEATYDLAGQSTNCPNCDMQVVIPPLPPKTNLKTTGMNIAALVLGVVALLVSSVSLLRKSKTVVIDPEDSGSIVIFDQTIKDFESQLREITNKTQKLEQTIRSQRNLTQTDYEAEITDLNNKVQELEREMSLSKLEKLLNEVAYLTPGSGGYSTLNYDLGVLTVSIDDVYPFANGSRVVLRFGNPLSTTVNGLKLIVDYGEVDSKGSPQNDDALSKSITFSDSLTSGSWTNVAIILDGLPSSRLGFLRIRDVSHTGIVLSTPR